MHHHLKHNAQVDKERNPSLLNTLLYFLYYLFPILSWAFAYLKMHTCKHKNVFTHSQFIANRKILDSKSDFQTDLFSLTLKLYFILWLQGECNHCINDIGDITNIQCIMKSLGKKSKRNFHRLSFKMIILEDRQWN